MGAETLQLASDAAAAAARAAAQLAKGAASAAALAARVADAAEHTAQVLAAYASQEESIAARYQSEAISLAGAYARQQARKAAALARAAARAVKKAAKAVTHTVARAAVVVAKAAYKYSGAQDVVSCVTDPTLSSCVKAAATVALVVATGGEGEIEVAAVDAAEEAGTDVAENVGADAAGDAGDSAAEDDAGSCPAGGGQSFTPGTKVLLASGAAVPISQLKIGEKVLATNAKTGKTQPETVTAVLVHHDTNLYDLKVRAAGKTAVIDTTRNHLFWAPGTGGHPGRWVKAGALRYGTHLRTPDGGAATAAGGWTPKTTTGWMWDLTVPGNNDHDFYIQTTVTAVLVHNVDDPSCMPGYRSFRAAKRDLGSPGPGNVYDHVVEQSQVGRSGFAPEEINHPFNLDPVDASVNQAKADYYASIRGFTGGQIVRQWLAGQSFADQYDFGMDILSRIQNGRPLP
jgi:hypothetical protein